MKISSKLLLTLGFVFMCVFISTIIIAQSRGSKSENKYQPNVIFFSVDDMCDWIDTDSIGFWMQEKFDNCEKLGGNVEQSIYEQI